jgi:hypothetical protein
MSFILIVTNKPFYAECRYAERRYAECRGAFLRTDLRKNGEGLAGRSLADAELRQDVLELLVVDDVVSCWTIL